VRLLGCPAGGLHSWGWKGRKASSPLRTHSGNQRGIIVNDPDWDSSRCDQPDVIGCAHCSCSFYVPCGFSDEDKCVPCARRKRSDWVRVIAGGVNEHVEAQALVFGWTITAAGQNVFSYDSALCSVKGRHRHSGQLGCKVNPVVAGIYNEEERRVWNDLTWSFVRALRRAYGEQVNLSYLSQREGQARGLVHRHGVNAIYGLPEGVLEADVKAIWVAQVEGHDFGTQHDVQFIADTKGAAKVAGYLAKYIAKGAGTDSVPWFSASSAMDSDTGEIFYDAELTVRRFYPAKSLSWPTSLKRLRFDRAEFVRKFLAEKALCVAGSLVASGGLPEGGALDGSSGAAALDSLYSTTYAKPRDVIGEWPFSG